MQGGNVSVADNAYFKHCFLNTQGAPITFWDTLFKTNSINFPKKIKLYVAYS